MSHENLNLMMIAGEASGDLHAAKLVRALREASPDTDFTFFGCAGPLMREAEVIPVVEADRLSVVGLAEIAGSLPMFLRARRKLINAAKTMKPAVAVLVDFPDFNLRLVKPLKKRDIPVIYYISPQLWAWREHRVRVIRDYVDLLITILPFEKNWYATRGVTNVEYVGSPLATEVKSSVSPEDFCLQYAFDPSQPLVSLLPGSRHKEIQRILPCMLAAAKLVHTSIPGIQFVIPVSEGENESQVGMIAKAEIAHRSSPFVKTVTGETYNALNASNAAAITSGTATLEAALMGAPMVIVYKTSSLNYRLLRPLISVEHFGLPNLVAEQRIVPELIQDDFTPAALASELIRLLDADVNRNMRTDLRQTVEKLGHGGASRRAAESILSLLQSKELRVTPAYPT